MKKRKWIFIIMIIITLFIGLFFSGKFTTYNKVIVVEGKNSLANYKSLYC